ncbi:hypothetical protein TNCT_404281 [Trichonephila clavata]|uniref:Uncharacterized protein n=1 Tax=Trichonephila clavata TaxID=2740835 RepID=A0A8X6HEY2_TRICU|nr:hypothetical protein TNCT_404281 [Trichonephila clavata]
MENDTEKVFLPPLPAVDFVFQQSSTPCLFDYKAMLQTSMDLLRHFKTQWIPLKQGNCPRTLIRKVISKAGPLLGSVPRFDSRGNLSSHPCHGPIHYSTSCVLMCRWTTEDLSG